MTGKKQPIKTRLILFSGTIVVLFILFFILQYNNYIITRKTVSYSNHINQTKILPGNLQVYHFKLIKNDIYNEQFYTLEKSVALDSINVLLRNYKNIIDSIRNSPYLPVSSKAANLLTSLRTDCDNLGQRYASLKRNILDRGLFTTGQSGEWHRYNNFLIDLANSINNPALMRATGSLNKLVNEYQINKNELKIRQILEYINFMKIQISGMQGPNAISLPDASRLKFSKELDSFYALTLALQKTDARTGLINNEGVIGETSLQLTMLQDKSNAIFEEIKSGIDRNLFNSFLLKVLLIIVFATFYILIIYYHSKSLNYSIEQIRNFSAALMLGKLPSHLKLSSNTEFEDISNNLNSFVASLRGKIKFASKLESGQSDTSLVPLSEEDTLANALLDMGKSLRKAAEEDKKYKIEEQKRAWTNEGIARFGEILRMQTDNLATLSDEIIKNLVKYLNANQGGIFLYNDDDTADLHLELISAFAFDRKKYLKKRVEIGEGLLGTCAQEKQTIFLTDIPENYVEITSGLGDAPPRSLVIVPLMAEKNIFGIVEIASLNIFQPYEIEFLEKIAQSIAATFATVKININTGRLLEQSKKQAEEMAQQEEEMRQNLEELQATQEESARREAEINSLINAVDASSIVIQTDMDGRITEVNNKFTAAIKMNRDEIVGRYLKSIFKFNLQTDEFSNLMAELRKGNKATRSEEIQNGHHHSFLEMHYSPIIGTDGKPYKIFGIATNITSYKNLEKTLQEKEETINSLDFTFNHYKEFIKEGFIICELSTDCLVTDVNENYAEITGYHIEELRGKDYRKFLKPDELRQFETIWVEVLKDKSYKGVIKRTKPTGEENWLMTSFVPFKDKNGHIDKIYLLAQDVTEKRLKYQVLEDANKEIERLKGLQKSEE